MNTADRALALVFHFETVASSEPTEFRDHGGIHKGWTRTARAKVALERAHRADRLYGRATGQFRSTRPFLP